MAKIPTHVSTTLAARRHGLVSARWLGLCGAALIMACGNSGHTGDVPQELGSAQVLLGSLFDIAELVITQNANGSLEILPTTVRWKGRQSFTINNSNPQCTDPNVVLPPGQPLSIGAVTPAPGNPGHRIATLSFTGAIEPSWHSHFDNYREITQLMQVGGGYGPQPLTIQFSCDEHP